MDARPELPDHGEADAAPHPGETGTARQVAEQAPGHWEACLRGLLDNFPDLVWVKDLDGRFLAVNQVFVRSCGRETVEDVLGRTDFDVWPRELARNYIADDRQVIASGRQKTGGELIADRGVTRWFETCRSPVRDRQGNIIGTAGFARDITQHKLAVDELRRSRLQFMAVLDGMDAFVYVADPRTCQLLLVNRYARDLIGDIEPGAPCWRGLGFNPGGPCPFCTNPRLLGPDGQPTGTHTWEFHHPVAQRWFQGRDRAIRWLDGSYVRLTIGTDITQRKAMEETLRSSEARHRGLLNAIPDPIFRLNRQGRILDFTEACQPNFQLSRETLPGAGIDRFLAAPAARELHDKIQQALATGAIQILECRWDFGRGSETHEVRLSVSGPDEVIAIVRNIEDRARLERMRQDFLHAASHELRTPLTTIMMMADLLQDGGNPDDQAEYWRVLASELERAHLLVEDLLAQGRLEHGNLVLAVRPVDIATVIERAVRSVQSRVRDRGIDLAVTVPAGLPPVGGTPDALLQVVTNLLNNAVKFTPGGGRVTVRVLTDPDGVILEVSDTGIGIPESEQPRLFERFFRASNTLEHDIAGTGIGLYLIKGIVDYLGGSITVASVLDRGATFTVRLPAALVHK